MKNKVNCVMLIDDNKDDNYFHTRIIRRNNVSERIIVAENGHKALEMIKEMGELGKDLPDLIFLDINMPNMNGWEFLDEYKKLHESLQSKVIIVMLTTSDNPEDIDLAMNIKTLADFKTKPLTNEMLDQIMVKYFD